MPSTFTASNGYEKIGSGEQDNTWGAALDNDMDLIDQSVDGVTKIVLTASSFSLNIQDGVLSDGRCKVIIFQGSPAGPVAVSITPTNIQKYYWIVNQSSQSVILSNGAGATLSVAATSTAPAFCDGAGNVVGLQAGNNNFSGIAVSGNATIGGTLTVTGNSTLGGTTTVDIITANEYYRQGQTIGEYINSLIPSITSMNGNLVISAIGFQGVSGGGWNTFTFGTVPGTRVMIAIGSGTGSDGDKIPVPFPFTTSQMIATCALGDVAASSGNNLDQIHVHMVGDTISATASDNEGHSFPVTVNWFGMCWLNNQ